MDKIVFQLHIRLQICTYFTHFICKSPKPIRALRQNTLNLLPRISFLGRYPKSKLNQCTIHLQWNPLTFL